MFFFPEIRCPIQSVPDAEVPTGNCTTVELSYGTRCSYYCRRGFERVGSETITCQLDKTWYPSAPVCDGKHIMLISTHSHRCKLRMFDLKNLPQFLFASVLLLMIQFRQSRQVDPQQNLEKAKLPIKMRKAHQNLCLFLDQRDVIVNIFSRLVIGSWSQVTEFHWLKLWVTPLSWIN